MLVIKDTLVSLDLLEKKFVCDLNACKGACCVEGDSGAPLNEEEASVLDDIYEDVKPYMTQNGKEAIEEQGKYIIDSEGDLVTPLINGKECAYTFFENGIANCAIEKAFTEGKTSFMKPVSCHLYPVRITNYSSYDAVNYHKWDICKPACKCGSELNVKVYQFLKAPLIRKYGEEWFRELKKADEALNHKK
jgi:hypothetical protein